MLQARSIALVGASPRPGSLGERMVAEAARSAARPRIHLVNPKYAEIGGRSCLPSLAEVPEPVDLVLLGVGDWALEQQLRVAAGRGDRSAVIFGGAYGGTAGEGSLRERLAAIARDAGMALCGGGCMGFVNVSYGLRAVGYVEPDPLPAGPIALITHSGSVFSAMLRTRRALGFTLAVSSGQELVTTAAEYAHYALAEPGTRVLALVLEAVRDAPLLRRALADAADADVPVVLLTAGSSAAGRAMVAAHSGALAGADGGWEALASAYGLHRVRDLAEMADTLEVFAAGRRAARPRGGPRAGGAGIATVHDSGMERAHIADLADELALPFARISGATRDRLAAVLDPGLAPDNPLDAWGTTADARRQLSACLAALADDEAVSVAALAVDLVREFDGDRSYPLAVLDAAAGTRKPLAVLCNVPSAIDLAVAAELRAAGVPVLEGARTGLAALAHLLAHADPPPPPQPASVDPARQARWQRTLRDEPLDGARTFALLADYGVRTAQVRQAGSGQDALIAAAEIGYPVALKTDEPIAHKSDVGGVLLGLADPDALARAYADLAARLGPRVLVCEQVPPGVELAVGITADAELGPLVVVGAGGLLVEHLADRAVALPPVDAATARRMISRLRVSRLLAGARGQAPADLDAAAAAIAAVSSIACELGGCLAGLDVNPLICGPGGAVAVDTLVAAAPGR